MDAQARSRGTSATRRQELFDLYLRRHDRIDTWDLVDRSAIWVVGEHLVDRPRDVLDELARDADPARRRTSILATMAFMRRGQLDDTFRIAAMLVADTDETVARPTPVGRARTHVLFVLAQSDGSHERGRAGPGGQLARGAPSRTGSTPCSGLQKAYSF